MRYCYWPGLVTRPSVEVESGRVGSQVEDVGFITRRKNADQAHMDAQCGSKMVTLAPDGHGLYVPSLLPLLPHV